MNCSEILEYLDREIDGAKPGDLPTIMGILEAAKGKAWTRLAGMKHSSGQEPDVRLTIKEAAERIGVTDRWLYRKAKTLPFTIRLGRKLLFSSQGLERWINQQRGRQS